ncbi:TetR family transcriptional regulator [Streptomyces sp. 3211.6]|uniref:TetR/AcrR family transcriptional regulator n=1 Tax=Streptomyces sp. 3211.6 TaxID=1938845 RepID=UPI000C2BAB85|nr:TetR/AcrR family transcriptional regulator [Streptomyces sp. 3211.6]RKT02452.1 TetR family transcriptional regulator [Streptomyces sp. 3211.6]
MDESPRAQPAERPRNAAATRLRLLEAAGELFAERGYERTTVRAIAERAGANQALLFRYFGSKHGLLTEVVARGSLEQLHATAPEDLFETALRSMLTRSAPGADRSLEVYLRSVGRGDEATGTLRELGGEYQKVLAGLAPGQDGALRADLAMAWLLGIGLMRTVAAREPLASADPETVCRLVLATLDRFWTLPPDDDGAEPGATGTEPPHAPGAS